MVGIEEKGNGAGFAALSHPKHNTLCNRAGDATYFVLFPCLSGDDSVALLSDVHVGKGEICARRDLR